MPKPIVEHAIDSGSSKSGHQAAAIEQLNRGATLLEAGEHEKALAAFDEAIRLDPSSAASHNGRGNVLLSKEEFEPAVAAFNESIRLDPAFVEPRASRASAFHALGEHGIALAAFDEALQLDPNSENALAGRGISLRDMQRHDEAIEDFSRLVEIGARTAWALAMRGLTLLYLREADEALSDFDRSIQLDATNAWIFNYRGAAHAAIGNHDSAIADYGEAIRLDPRLANAYFNRGRTFEEMDDFDRAISDFTKVIDLESEEAQTFYYRAMVWKEMSEPQKALDDLGEAILLDPSYRKAFELRSSIRDDLGDQEQSELDLDRADELRQTESPEGTTMRNRKNTIYHLLERHFEPTALDSTTVTERRFPARVRADLQMAIDRFVSNETTPPYFCGVRKQYHHQGINLSELLIQDRNDPAMSVPPQYEEVDIGETETVKCSKDGLWLLAHGDQKFVLFLEPPSEYGRAGGIRFQVATINDEPGASASEAFFKWIEKSVLESTCYRGKVLSLQRHDHYSGVSTGITVHKLKSVEREQVILPRKTLELLERNVIHFVAQRPKLKEFGISTKKGLLFYGPPGTGKTHTIHFLSDALKGHTTLLITAEQVGLLDEYMTLARLLQPSIVLIEDADLIARDRAEMHDGCEEVLLNKLLNEMDGLQQDADILFILTTNRPETLEAALASRPGRIDQAIEFPLPDDEGRRKLIRLYTYGVTVHDDVVDHSAKKTQGVSAAFIKELMRRAVQFHLERANSSTIEIEDVDNAIEELLFSGGTLNRKLLGAGTDE